MRAVIISGTNSVGYANSSTGFVMTLSRDLEFVMTLGERPLWFKPDSAKWVGRTIVRIRTMTNLGGCRLPIKLLTGSELQ